MWLLEVSWRSKEGKEHKEIVQKERVEEALDTLTSVLGPEVTDTLEERLLEMHLTRVPVLGVGELTTKGVGVAPQERGETNG